MSFIAGSQPTLDATHSRLTSLISDILPPKVNDVNFLYHIPRYHGYIPSQAKASDIVLSITPTESVYTALNSLPPRSNPVCFLHRPWSLDRRRVPKGTLVLANHKTFDELLTVGWNPILAAALGFIAPENAICVQGYKDDPDRKIGLIAGAGLGGGQLMEDVVSRIRAQFGGEGDFFDNGCSLPVGAIAIMNAFNPEQVELIAETVRKGELATVDTTVLYLTGQVREFGLEAARMLGMPVMCVGHWACEEWGVRYLASALRTTFPGTLRVHEVSEQEEKPLISVPRRKPDDTTTSQVIAPGS